MRRLAIHGCALLACGALFWACTAEDGHSLGPDGETCNTTECYAACQTVGHDDGGYCEGGECICHGADAGTDTATDPGVDDMPSDWVPPPSSCDIDILFVVDTSGSMMDAAENLAGVAFPNFASELESYPTLDLGIYRVAVTNHLYGEREVGDTMVQHSRFLTSGWPVGVPHDEFDCEEIPSVDCGFASGESWMLGPSTTLHDEFGCVGRVACQQDIYAGEPTLQSGLEALRFPENAGFLRDHALLVVVYITDEDDQSTMSLDLIRSELLALKGGSEEYVVVITMGGGPEGSGTYEHPLTGERGCLSDDYGSTFESPRLIEFAGLFGTRGRHYNLCEDDISSALTDALTQIGVSCSEILI